MANTTEITTICGIGHIAFNVADMEKSLAFYCEVLGFKHAFTLRNASGEPWIEYLKIADNNFVELFYARPGGQAGQAAPAPQAFNHLCIRVGDIHATEKALDGAGWPVDTRPKQGSDKNWQMWARDPDGTRIEFMQISPDSPQAQA